MVAGLLLLSGTGGAREPAKEMTGRLVGRGPVERHDCRGRTSVAGKLGTPAIAAHGQHFDDIGPTVDDFVLQNRLCQGADPLAEWGEMRRPILVGSTAGASESACEAALGMGEAVKSLGVSLEIVSPRQTMHSPCTILPQVFHSGVAEWQR